MTTQPFDPVRYKEGLRLDWDAVASGWKQWWKTIEQGAQPVSDRLVALAKIQPGHWVLDVATGIGEPAITAARIVGPTGRVVGIDQAPRMLAIARERAMIVARKSTGGASGGRLARRKGARCLILRCARSSA